MQIEGCLGGEKKEGRSFSDRLLGSSVKQWRTDKPRIHFGLPIRVSPPTTTTREKNLDLDHYLQSLSRKTIPEHWLAPEPVISWINIAFVRPVCQKLDGREGEEKIASEQDVCVREEPEMLRWIGSGWRTKRESSAREAKGKPDSVCVLLRFLRGAVFTFTGSSSAPQSEGLREEKVYRKFINPQMDYSAFRE